MKSAGCQMVFVVGLFSGFQGLSLAQVPGFNFLENLPWKQPVLALEHWSSVDALSSSFTAPIRDRMHARLNAVLIHSNLNAQVFWGHSIPWGEQESLVLYGGMRRHWFQEEGRGLWSFLWRCEGHVKGLKNAWHPFLEWSIPLRSSVEQAPANLRFGGLLVRQFERGEMQVLWQWIEPSWMLDVKFFLPLSNGFSLGFTGQFQPRIWGLICRVSLDGFITQMGLAPVPMGGWRSRWSISQDGPL